MARKKRQWLDDDDPDSSSGSDNEGGDFGADENDPDLRAERELFQNPYQRGGKRRKVDGSDDEDEGFGGGSSSRTRGEQRVNWAKAPSFVSGDTIKPDMERDILEAEEEMAAEEAAENAAVDEESSSEESSQSEPRGSPRVPDQEKEDEPPVRSGFGASKSMAAKFGLQGATATPTNEPAMARSGRGGIGSKKPASIPEDDIPEASTSFSSAGLPTAFGTPGGAANGAPRVQQSFLRNENAAAAQAANLTAEEKRHFSGLQGSYGARLLEKMGWQVGTGLGPQSQGIVTPIETKLRPAKAGIAFRGFKEKTEQSKAEARRRGEVVSDDEEPRRGKGKGKQKQDAGRKADAWREPKKAKARVVHKTYEQIVQEAGGDLPPPTVGTIIDVTGATPREISIADISTASWTPSTDPMRLPEVRHNLRLLVDVAKGDLNGLAREAKALKERKKWVEHEDDRLRKAVANEAELIARLQRMHIIAEDISAQAKEAAGQYEPSLDMFAPNFERLLIDYSVEYDQYHFDEVVVGAITPIVRRLLAQWNPLEEPALLTDQFRRWRKAFKMSTVPVESSVVDIYGTRTTVKTPQPNPSMTPYESLVWNIWLPKVRSTINNDWSPLDPSPLIHVIEAWSDLLPQFVYDNVMDQLIIPKLHKAVADFNLRRDKVSLQAMVFPWLPHVGLRVEEVLNEARRKVKSLFRAWAVTEGIPEDIIAWKYVFDASDWEGMLLKYVVPKLGATLRDDFKINPRKQNMEPLNWVLKWANLIRPSTFSHLLEAEFFPKWLDILHMWLVSPNPNFDEVTQWYSFWKSSFPDDVRELPGVADGFTQALQLMNKAIELGPRAATQLPKPNYRGNPPSGSRGGTPQPGTKAKRTRPAPTEVTFRSIVEEFASSHNLLFIPTGKSEEKSRMPLFRLSQNLDGKGGINVYLLDDVVWAPDGESGYRAIPLDEMVLRATRGRA